MVELVSSYGRKIAVVTSIDERRKLDHNVTFLGEFVIVVVHIECEIVDMGSERTWMINN